MTSISPNQPIITAASSVCGGLSRTSLLWMTGPYMARKCMTVLFRPFGANGVYGVRRFGTFGATGA